MRVEDGFFASFSPCNRPDRESSWVLLRLSLQVTNRMCENHCGRSNGRAATVIPQPSSITGKSGHYSCFPSAASGRLHTFISSDLKAAEDHNQG